MACLSLSKRGTLTQRTAYLDLDCVSQDICVPSSSPHVTLPFQHNPTGSSSPKRQHNDISETEGFLRREHKRRACSDGKMSSFKVIKTQCDDQLESHTSLRTQIKGASKAVERHVDALIHENNRIRLERASVCKLLAESRAANSVLQADLRHVNNRLQTERRLAKQCEQMLRNENITLQRGYDEAFDILVKACQALAMDDRSRPEHEVVVERSQRVRRMDARVVRRIERRWHRSTGMNSVQIIERQAHQLWSQQETLKRVRSERNAQQDWLTQCLQDLERLSAIVRTANQPLVDASGAKDGEALCAICLADSGNRVLEDDDQLVTLYCNHRYCRPCLAKWTNKNRTCPTCRRYIGRHR